MLSTPGAWAAPEGPQPKLSQKSFDAWTRDCAPPGSFEERCILRQTYTGKNENVLLVAEISVYRETKEHVMHVTVPPGILLLAPLQIMIDGKKQAELPYIRCTPGGCHTSTSLPPEFIDKLKKGQKMTFAYALPDQSFIEAPLSLHGVTAGLKSLAL